MLVCQGQGRGLGRKIHLDVGYVEGYGQRLIISIFRFGLDKHSWQGLYMYRQPGLSRLDGRINVYEDRASNL